MIRRDASPDLADVGQDEALVERIRAEIRAGGPMPFDRFMAYALYDPDGGYYRSADARPGRAGDFLTAPELHPIFGATIATGLEDIWNRLGKPAPFTVREHGAGTGALAAAILDELDASGSGLARAIRYEAVDIDPRLVTTLRHRLTEAGHASKLGWPVSDDSFVGVVLANEVLDALPVHRVRRGSQGLRELVVDLDRDGRLVEREIEPTTPALAARLRAEAVELEVGQTAEVCLALDEFVGSLSVGLRQGLVVLIDYGAPAYELYDPVRRRDGTLRAYVRHQVHDDPYRHVGRQDLTAHVDVTAVEQAAHAAGLRTVGLTTQAEALIGLGIEDRLRAIQHDPATTFEDLTLVRSALRRLLDPAAMGRFRVMAFGQDWPSDPDDSPLRLFAYRLPDRAPRPADGP